MHSTPSRRRGGRPLAGVAVTLAAALALAGCASGAEPSATTSASASGRDTITIALPGPLVSSLDPRDGGSIRLDASLHSAVYSSLTTIDPELEVVGDIATAWEQAEDGLSWTFTLRDDVAFENGDPLDADVVAWNINDVIGNKTASLATLSAVTDAEAIDPTTVVIRTSKPFLELPRKLTTFYFIDPVWAQDPGNDTKTTANASGPYSVVSYDPQAEVVLTRNDSYHGTAPDFENARYVVIPTAAGRLAALQTGEIDLSIVLEPQDLALIEGASNLVVGSIESNRNQVLRFNTLRPPFDDQQVRLALNYAVDKEAIAQSVLKGLVEPSKGQIINELYSGFDPSLKAYPYDPEKAKELLAEAGYDESNPLVFDLDYSPGSYVGVELTAQAIQQQLAEIGVTVNFNVLEWSAWVKSAGSEEGPTSTFVGYSSGDNSNYQILGYFKTGFVQNHANDPVYDELVDAIDAAPTVEEQIDATRKAVERSHEWAQMLWLFPQPQTYAHAADLTWVPRPDDWLRPQDVHPAS